MAEKQRQQPSRKRPPPKNEIQTRPTSLVSKQGSTGSKVILQSNYFELTSKTDWCLYQYRVDIAPDEDRTIVRKSLLRTHKAKLGAYIFDGTVLYTSHRLPQPMELQSIRLEDKQPMSIKIKLVGDLDRGDYHYIQFFNIIVRKCLEHLQLQLVGRNYYDAASRIEIREFRLELWPGYVTSIRQHEKNILMCAEISHKVMRNQTLLDLLNEIYSNSRSNRNYQKLYAEAVIGSVVLTDYNNRTYKIDDVDYNMTPDKTFSMRDGSKISYATYYKQKYQINIRNLKQPLLVSRSKARERRAGNDELIYLIPELCRTTGLTDEMRNNFNLMRALSNHTRIIPETRIQKLLNFNRRLKSKPEIIQEFKEWNFDLSSNLVEVPARILPEESIYLGANRVAKVKNADWNFTLQESPLCTVGQLKEWFVVVPKQSMSQTRTFIDTMIAAAAKMKFEISKPRYEEIIDDKSHTILQKLEKVTNTYAPQLILCIVSNNQLQRYSVIKKKLCVDRAIPSQVLLARTLNQKSQSMLNAVSSKVAVQLNCKIGGIPWSTDIGRYLPGLMVVGYDVCHDKTSGGKDFGAMVASLDQKFGRYFSSVSHHPAGEELSNDLSHQLTRAIGAFRQENGGKLPSRIIIYRDGVGEGQIPFVYDYEVKLIKKRLAEIYGNPDAVKLAVIVVTKRINTRLFYNKKNPPPGTVVDDVVTDPLKHDFFIVSQSVKQGTVAPTAYNVIENTVCIPPDKIQLVTYKLTHMYFNFTGTVRVPAPCQYAHKLAFFVSQTIQQPANESLEKLLYFL